MKVLACYDIADKYRLKEVSKIMQDYGERVQKSIFELDVGKKEFKNLVKTVEQSIELEEDRVSYYLLCSSCEQLIYFFGQYQKVEKPVEYIII